MNLTIKDYFSSSYLAFRGVTFQFTIFNRVPQIINKKDRFLHILELFLDDPIVIVQKRNEYRLKDFAKSSKVENLFVKMIKQDAKKMKKNVGYILFIFALTLALCFTYITQTSAYHGLYGMGLYGLYGGLYGFSPFASEAPPGKKAFNLVGLRRSFARGNPQ